MKTSDLIGPALDWAVAETEGRKPTVATHDIAGAPTPFVFMQNGDYRVGAHFSTAWAQGRPLIEREGINVRRGNDLHFPKGNEKGDFIEALWLASVGNGPVLHGTTPLIAAMRCYVASKLGDEIDTPKELQ